jgi:hypothetical protein
MRSGRARYKAVQQEKEDIRAEQAVFKGWKRVNEIALWRLKFPNNAGVPNFESPGEIYQNMRLGLREYPSLKTPEEVGGSRLPQYYPL